MLPTFDLIVATVGRTHELHGLLDSLEGQTYQRFRVIVVDQNDDGRLAGVATTRSNLSVVRLTSARGLSRARNAALAQAAADVVAFPDDDCVYVPDLLERLAGRFASRPDLDGIAGRTEDASGSASPNWDRVAGPLTTANVWYRSNSNSIFLRRRLVEQVGAFDESLGLGSDMPWASGEDTDYLVRAVLLGAAVEYDPDVVVVHPEKQLDRDALRRLRYRDGASVGYILGKHRYPPREIASMLIRPVGGATASLARRDLDGAKQHAAALRGRIVGVRGGRRWHRGARSHGAASRARR